MGATLYLQCETGISGDMVVGALLDVGADEAGLRAALASLPLEGYKVRISRKLVSGVDCCDFDVVMDAEHENHDHDMAYLYGNLDGEAPGGHASHEHEHEHEHEHGAAAAAHGHHHAHRNLGQVLDILNAAALTPHARDLAERVFRILADAEGKAHGKPADQVHFHEVGAVDSIVDITAAAFCLDNLDVTDVVVGPLAEGHGRVRTQHGVLAVPVPAVAHIVADHGLVMARHDIEGELVTPTGAAIAAAFRTSDRLPDAYRVKAVGTGSGKRAYEPVSTVRAMLIEPVETSGDDGCGSRSNSAGQGATSLQSAQTQGEAALDVPGSSAVQAPFSPNVTLSSHAATDALFTEAQARNALWKLETEVDDCTGEALGFALEHLFEAGVREAHYVPVFMKKNRPGYQIEVVCTYDLISDVERILFEDTTTIGVRRYPLDRTALVRRGLTVDTPFGPVQVKEAVLPDGTRRFYPEHDSVAAIAREQGIGYQDALRNVRVAIARSLL